MPRPSDREGKAYQPPGYLAQRERIPGADFLVDWYLAQRNDATQVTRGKSPTRFRASGIGGCARSVMLKAMGVEVPRVYDAKTLRTFAWGDYVHDFARGMFVEMGLVIDEEPYLSDPSRHVGGSVDLIWSPDHPYVRSFQPYADALHSELSAMYAGVISNTLVGYEIKSAHSVSMKYIFNDGPQEAHKMQAGLYKHMATVTKWADVKDYDIRDVERWFIVYIGKDAVGVLQYEVEDAWVDLALNRVDMLNTHWEAGTLPPCVCTSLYGGKGPQYCDFQEGKSCCGRDLKGAVARELRQRARKGR